MDPNETKSPEEEKDKKPETQPEQKKTLQNFFCRV